MFRQLVSDAGLEAALDIDSAGTAGYHSGEPPDRRARAAGKRAGIAVAGQARQFLAADFEHFEYVIAMDASNVTDLQRIAPSLDAARKIRLLRSFDAGFDEVLELCRTACVRLLQEIRKEHRL